jgi:hypothetical protein
MNITHLIKSLQYTMVKIQTKTSRLYIHLLGEIMVIRLLHKKKSKYNRYYRNCLFYFMYIKEQEI